MSLDQLDITHHWVEEEIYLKRAFIRKGLTVGKHSHPYDHSSYLVSGSVLLDIDGHKEKHDAPKILLVKANKTHTISALSDSVWYCSHITSDTNPETVDETILK